jgi:formyl-CoA transferase
MAQLLAGIRVLDVASYIAGPVATTVMADFGADVVKVEPLVGDTYRRSIRSPAYPPSPHNFPWIVDNRSKRGLALDLRRPEERSALHRLVGTADVFVTNLPLDARPRLGVRYEDLAPLNARLIYASITAYGERGEEAGRTGFDSTALWARTGLMDLVRPSPDAPPSRSLPGMGDHPTGMSLFGAIMAGLYQRERTGRGAMVSTSLMANGLWWNAIQVQGALCGALVRPRPPREESANALSNLYRCRHGRWFLLAINVEERDWAEWCALLDAHGITVGAVAALEDIPHDRQMQASGALVPIDDPRAGARLTVSSPIWMDGQDKRPPALAPALGEHSVEILREAGFSDAEVDRLLALGVVAQARADAEDRRCP